jgi:hypothetical protein
MAYSKAFFSITTTLIKERSNSRLTSLTRTLAFA